MPKIKKVVNETGTTNIYKQEDNKRYVLMQHSFHITDKGLNRNFLNYIMNKNNSFFKKSWIKHLMRSDVKISIATRFDNIGWRSGNKFKSIMEDWDIFDPLQYEYDYDNILEIGNITDFKIYLYVPIEYIENI